MKKSLSVLLVGESALGSLTEYKGIDYFVEADYLTSADQFIASLESKGHKVTQIPCHLISRLFPRTLKELSKYDVVLISDVGSNSFLLLPEVAKEGKRAVNLLNLICDYVAGGGGFAMIGGYLTFQGFNAKGCWKDTPIEGILPVTLREGDDRRELPEGADLVCKPDSHPILKGLPAAWPYILGYNRLKARKGAEVVLAYEGDPIITAGAYKKGRTLAYATDCSPHWASPDMCSWAHYSDLWDNILRWLAGQA